ncbi:hypothetical protein ABZ858_33355 [Streptomyces sp. NPDC047017]|uniref:hypothetical protein n=1 Tax=Streptomyces sp. NPDC047017 TaxID=3155024 RepID=UPI0033D58FCB
MLGRPVAHPGRVRARHVRGVGAALVAVAALVTAANVGGLARAADPGPDRPAVVQDDR